MPGPFPFPNSKKGPGIEVDISSYRSVLKHDFFLLLTLKDAMTFSDHITDTDDSGVASIDN